MIVAAANLGAYMFQKTEEEVEEALRILTSVENTEEVGTCRDGSICLYLQPSYQFEYLNYKAPKAVIERFGMPSIAPSLGIPTYR